MEIIELLDKLDMESPEDIAYIESFCELMEIEEEIPEDVFFQMFNGISLETLKELTDDYLEEIMTGIPDDNLDFYAFLSSYKRNLGGMINYFMDEGNKNAVVSELYHFREWYTAPDKVHCTDMDENREFDSSICNALVLGRMERLSIGNYAFDFDDAMDLEYDDYEDYADRDIMDDDPVEIEDDDPSITLIDRDDPVIDGEMYDEYEGDGILQ
ncbi:MAG: hypothetical protein E7228_05245 [Clostridiales bacterium]|nr:hypothetical protein [Clostridiales bacterium]